MAAKAELQQVLERQPDHVLAGFLMGQTLDAGGKGELAAELYAAVLTRDPDHVGAHYFLAVLAFRQGDYTRAETHFSAALAADVDVRPAACLVLLSGYRAGKIAEETAARRLAALLQADPSQPRLRYAMARLRLDAIAPLLRDPAAALQLADGLVREMPTPPHLALLALARAANGQRADAEQALAQLAFIPPWLNELDMPALRAAVADFANRPPGEPWPSADGALGPPPLQVEATMMEYPAAVPY